MCRLGWHKLVRQRNEDGEPFVGCNRCNWIPLKASRGAGGGPKFGSM